MSRDHLDIAVIVQGTVHRIMYSLRECIHVCLPQNTINGIYQRPLYITMSSFLSKLTYSTCQQSLYKEVKCYLQELSMSVTNVNH